MASFKPWSDTIEASKLAEAQADNDLIFLNYFGKHKLIEVLKTSKDPSEILTAAWGLARVSGFSLLTELKIVVAAIDLGATHLKDANHIKKINEFKKQLIASQESIVTNPEQSEDRREKTIKELNSIGIEFVVEE